MTGFLGKAWIIDYINDDGERAVDLLSQEKLDEIRDKATYRSIYEEDDDESLSESRVGS